MIFCIVFLDHFFDLTDLGLVWFYSLKSQGNHNIFCPFHNQLMEISDHKIAGYRCISVFVLTFHNLEIDNIQGREFIFLPFELS